MEGNSQNNRMQQEFESIKTEIKTLSAGYAQLDRSLGHMISTSRFAFGFVIVLLSVLTIAGSLLSTVLYNIGQDTTQTRMGTTQYANSIESLMSTLENMTNISNSLIGEVEKLKERVEILEDAPKVDPETIGTNENPGGLDE